MKCSSVREKLFDYIDGALKGSDLQAVEDHLKSCSECRHELEKVQQLDARLQQEIPAYVESIEPAPAFLNRLKSLDLEPEASPGPISNMLNSFFSIFQEHRMAFGTGLAVLIMIAIGLSIPTVSNHAYCSRYSTSSNSNSTYIWSIIVRWRGILFYVGCFGR